MTAFQEKTFQRDMRGCVISNDIFDLFLPAGDIPFFPGGCYDGGNPEIKAVGAPSATIMLMMVMAMMVIMMFAVMVIMTMIIGIVMMVIVVPMVMITIVPMMVRFTVAQQYPFYQIQVLMEPMPPSRMPMDFSDYENGFVFIFKFRNDPPSPP